MKCEQYLVVPNDAFKVRLSIKMLLTAWNAFNVDLQIETENIVQPYQLYRDNKDFLQVITIPNGVLFIGHYSYFIAYYSDDLNFKYAKMGPFPASICSCCSAIRTRIVRVEGEHTEHLIP